MNLVRLITLTFNFSIILTVPCSWTPSKVMKDVSGYKKNVRAISKE